MSSLIPAAHRPRRHARRTVAWALALVVLGACDAPTGIGSIGVLSAELSSPAPFTRALEVQLDRASELTVEYWTEGDARLRVQAPAAQWHSIALTRLRPGRTYRYEIVGSATTGTFTTGALPADVAAAVGSATGRHTAPLVLLHLFHPTGFKGYVILDEHDEVVWYWRTTDLPYGMTRRANGNFVFMDKVDGLAEVTPSGTLVHELAQDVANREMHHDVITSSTNTLLFIAFDDRVVNGATVRGEAIWEWSPETEATSRRWTSWDHFTLSTTPAPRANREWMHANSLAIGPRGNVLMSVHYWNQIISITGDWRGIEWRLGGAGATHPLSPAEAFSGQHTAREISPGRVVLFDNGTERGGFSRAIEYALETGAARTVWEWRSQPLNFAAAVGSARRLGNGNTMIAFGMQAGLAGSTGPTEVYEVDAAGRAVWHLVTNTQVMYRAEPLTSIGEEEVVSGP